MFIPSSLSWPIAIVVCVSIGLASVLVLYLVVRIRSGHRHRRSTTATGDDVHSQMEWEDDIGLNITVNPLDETKKSTAAPPTVKIHQLEQTLHDYDGASSEEDDFEEQHYGEYSSEGEDEEVAEEEEDDEEDEDEDEENEDDHDHHRRIHPRQAEHQLEWDDDVAIGYGPKKV